MTTTTAALRQDHLAARLNRRVDRLFPTARNGLRKIYYWGRDGRRGPHRWVLPDGEILGMRETAAFCQKRR